ncbi:MAG: hypothetical protein Q4F05_08585 [bacterium]|nr:hypothetical protein [bacterium]
MERFHEKEVVFPKTKAYARGNAYIQALEKVIVPGKILLQISSYQEKDSLMLEVYRILSSSSEFSMNQLVVCIKEASKIMKTSMGHMSNVSVVEENSKEYIEHLATAEFIFSNENLPTYFVRRDGQSLIIVPGGKNEYRISLLLNATCLVSFSQTYTNLIYKEHYRLEGIYKGQIAQPATTESIKEYAFCLIQVSIMREQCNQVLCSYLSGSKRRVLFVMDLSRDKILDFSNQLSLLQQMDDSCETVLLLTSQSEGVYQELKRMLPKVHIIIKQGKVSYTNAGYVRLERMRYLFSHCETISTVFEDRPEQELAMEWHRLLGPATFEQAYLISPHTVFWYAMFLEVASLKTGVFPRKSELLCLNGQKAERIYDSNTSASLRRFDKIVLFQDQWKNQLHFGQSGFLDRLCIIDPEYCTMRMDKPLEMVTINQQNYYECDFVEIASHNYAATFVRAKQRGRHSILIYGKNPEAFRKESFLELIKRLKEEQLIQTYLSVPCVNVQQMNTELELRQTDLEYVNVIYEYLLTEELTSLMDTLVVIGEESKKIRYLSQLHNKPYIRLEGKEDVETFLDYLHGEATDTFEKMPFMTAEEYLCGRKQEMRKLLT